MKIMHVVGTRPNFMKSYPIIRELEKNPGVKQVLVHTGQHFDENMSRLFFEDLKLPKPDYSLGIHEGSTIMQLSDMMEALEKVFLKEKPDMVVVVGDVNSTLAAAVAANKLQIFLVHVESGLRSFDLKMPEEVNRILVDHMSDHMFTTEMSANKNLIKENIPESKFSFVGNVMIDTLLSHRKEASRSSILKDLDIMPKGYAVLTLHRPSNVDSRENFDALAKTIRDIQKKVKIIFPMHPRTKAKLEIFGSMRKLGSNVLITEPQGYLDFLCLMDNSRLILTDSGGIQEEATVLGVPCITLRENTERPITVEKGSNVLVSTDRKKIIKAVDMAMKNPKMKFSAPDLWDGKAAQRIVKILLKLQHGKK